MPVARRRRGIAGWVLLAVGLVAAAVVAWTARTGNEPARLPSEGSLAIAGGADFDPSPDGAENPEQIPFLFDGLLETVWSTEGYRAPPDQPFGDRAGVGFILELQEEAVVEQLVLQAVDPGISLEVYVARNLPDPVDGLVGWGLPADQFDDLGRFARLELGEPVAGQWVLVWLTGLTEVEPSLQRAQIREVQVRGTPLADDDASP